MSDFVAGKFADNSLIFASCQKEIRLKAIKLSGRNGNVLLMIADIAKKKKKTDGAKQLWRNLSLFRSPRSPMISQKAFAGCSSGRYFPIKVRN